MSETQAGSKGKMSIIKGLFLAGVFSFIIGLGVKVYYSCFNIKPKYYASFFYAWRRSGADQAMTTGKYSYIVPNKYEKTEQRDTFYKFAQQPEKFLLIKHAYPEHFPREAGYQPTLLFDSYESFLTVRYNFITKVMNPNAEKEFEAEYSKWHDREENKKAFPDATEFSKIKDDKKESVMKKIVEERKKGTEKYFGLVENTTTTEIGKKIFDGKELSGWKDLAYYMSSVMINLMDNKAEYKFKGEEPGQGLVDDIAKGAKAVGFEVTKDDVKSYYKNFGMAAPSVQLSFAYSRCFYIFDFISANLKLTGPKASENEKEKTKSLTELWEEYQKAEAADKAKKLKSYSMARMDYVANIFAYIFTLAYQDPIMEKASEESGFANFMISYFGPSFVKSDINEEDLANVKKELENFKKGNQPSVAASS